MLANQLSVKQFFYQIFSYFQPKYKNLLSYTLTIMYINLCGCIASGLLLSYGCPMKLHIFSCYPYAVAGVTDDILITP